MEHEDTRDRAIGKCTECGEERHSGRLRMFRRGGLPVCDNCKRQPEPRRPFGDPRYDGGHAPLITGHV